MSRLIDADALIEDIRKRSYIDKALCEIFETIIDEQPTAYDVDKVVEQLEERSAWHQKYGDTDGYTFVGYEGAIEIVKAGGINENKI